MNVIHAGKYSDTALNKLINYNPVVLDNRIVNIESYVKPGQQYYAKSILEKGWKIQQNMLIAGDTTDIDFITETYEEE